MQQDLEAEEIKEVYAQYGLAVYQAQCLERQIAILLATACGPGPTKMTRSQYDELLDALFDKTLGGLLQTLERSGFTLSDLKSSLRDALKTRNWLVHQYFWERAGHFLTEQGRKKMLNELQAVQVEFDRLDRFLIQPVKEWQAKVGVPESAIQLAMENLVTRSLQES